MKECKVYQTSDGKFWADKDEALAYDAANLKSLLQDLHNVNLRLFDLMRELKSKHELVISKIFISEEGGARVKIMEGADVVAECLEADFEKNSVRSKFEVGEAPYETSCTKDEIEYYDRWRGWGCWRDYRVREGRTTGL